MPYVKGDGTIVERNPFGFFWGFLNFFYLMFQTLVNPGYDKKDDNGSSGSGSPGSGKRMGGFGPSGSGSPDPPPMGGCSSCG